MARLRNYLYGKVEDEELDPMTIALALIRRMPEHEVAEFLRDEEFVMLPHDEMRDAMYDRLVDMGRLSLANRVKAWDDDDVEPWLDQDVEDAVTELCEQYDAERDDYLEQQHTDRQHELWLDSMAHTNEED